jgi:hypothetical protein
MKVRYVLLALGILMAACEPAKTPAQLEAEAAAATPQPKPGDWLYDKEKRRNPLEAPPHSRK